MLAVRYEDLLADTAGQLGRIVRFLQLAGVAEAPRRRQLSAAQVREIVGSHRETMATFGYAPQETLREIAAFRVWTAVATMETRVNHGDDLDDPRAAHHR